MSRLIPALLIAFLAFRLGDPLPTSSSKEEEEDVKTPPEPTPPVEANPDGPFLGEIANFGSDLVKVHSNFSGKS